MKLKVNARKKVVVLRRLFFLSLVFVVAVPFLIPVMFAETGKVKFEDLEPREQVVQFIKYFHTLELTPEQKEIKNKALSSIPAPCCSDYSIATCCCPCNLAKSVWGLASYLIAERGYSTLQVRKAVEEWIQTTNPAVYSGEACHDGHCNQPFEKDGCGGMKEKVIF